MRNNETKEAMIEALNVMIQNVAQGASGFWVEDYRVAVILRFFLNLRKA